MYRVYVPDIQDQTFVPKCYPKLWDDSQILKRLNQLMSSYYDKYGPLKGQKLNYNIFRLRGLLMVPRILNWCLYLKHFRKSSYRKRHDSWEGNCPWKLKPFKTTWIIIHQRFYFFLKNSFRQIICSGSILIVFDIFAFLDFGFFFSNDRLIASSIDICFKFLKNLLNGNFLP